MLKWFKNLALILFACLVGGLWFAIILPLLPWHLYRIVKIKQKMSYLLKSSFKNLPITSCELQLLSYGAIDVRKINGEEFKYHAQRRTRTYNPYQPRMKTSNEMKSFLVAVNFTENDLARFKRKIDDLVLSYVPFSSENVTLLYSEGKVKLVYSFLKFWRYSPAALFYQYFDLEP